MPATDRRREAERVFAALFERVAGHTEGRAWSWWASRLPIINPKRAPIMAAIRRALSTPASKKKRKVKRG